MELKKIKDEKRIIQVEVVGEGTTFINLLKEALLSDKYVTSAAVIVDHPLTSNPEVFVRTKKGKSPEKALKDAADLIKKQVGKFEKKFKKAK